MNRAAVKTDYHQITTTYVWRVALCYQALDKYVELLVLCDEQLPGERFRKAIEDTFIAYQMNGKIPEGYPSRLQDYVIKMTNNIGLAAGAVSKNKAQPGHVAIGQLANGVPVMFDAEQAVRLAGLQDVHDNPSYEKTEREKRRKLKETQQLIEDSENVLHEVLLDTAAVMARDGDMASVDETALQQAIAAVQVTNPTALMPPAARVGQVLESIRNEFEHNSDSDVKKTDGGEKVSTE